VLEGERTDAARVAEAVAAAFDHPLDALEASAGAVGIHAAGLSADIAFCAQESITAIVPRLVRMQGDVAVVEADGTSVEAPAASGAVQRNT